MLPGLPKKFAVVGLLIGLTFMLFWKFDYVFNPFGLPSAVGGPANYTEPLARTVITDVSFVLCPGQFLYVFTIGIDGWFSWAVGMLAALLNVPLYYVIGLIVASAFPSRRSGSPVVGGPGSGN